jgi:hypothetical protein
MLINYSYPPSLAAVLGNCIFTSDAPSPPRCGGVCLRGASAVLGRGDGVPSQPLPLRVGLWRRGVEGEVALLRAGGAELRRGDRGRGARGCDPTQAALPRRRRRPLRLRPRGLRSRCAVPHCNPLFFFL